MAIFSKKTKEETAAVEETPVVDETPSVDMALDTTAEIVQTTVPLVGVVKNRLASIVPRMSEKITNMEKLNKYVFRVDGKSNKVEIRKALEKTYGVKIDRVNIVTVKSRSRRYGKTSGRVGAFKKAIVTLKPDSKKIEIAEAI